MANWYTTREAVKTAAGITAPIGASLDSAIDSAIEAASRQIDNCTHTFFYPRTETRLYRWPRRQPGRSIELWLDQYLVAVTTLQTKAQDSSPTTISSSDYFIEPVNTGPPYTRIEIDQSSTASFEGGDTPQRSISVAGRFGYAEDTRSAGTVSSGIAGSASATTMVCSDASLIDVGSHLLIESEQLFVSDRSFAALDSILINGALTATQNQTTVTVDGSSGINAGEIIRLDSERMLVISRATNDLTVVRAYDGSTLAAHSDDTAVHINRTLTIERGLNGTTAATHSDSTAVSVYEPPFDVQNAARDWTLLRLDQTRSRGAVESESGRRTESDIKMALMPYRRQRMATV
jgi:hypothetical protein